MLPVCSSDLSLFSSISFFNDTATTEIYTLSLHDALPISSRRVRTLRDPTRGGLAATLNEIAAASGVAIEVDESSIPFRSEVRAACELLGLDPLVLANEGKLVAFVARRDADKVLGAMREHAYGAGAVIIGEVQESEKPRVYLRTLLGSRRILSMPTGEQLPRIC